MTEALIISIVIAVLVIAGTVIYVTMNACRDDKSVTIFPDSGTELGELEVIREDLDAINEKIPSLDQSYQNLLPPDTQHNKYVLGLQTRQQIQSRVGNPNIDFRSLHHAKVLKDHSGVASDNLSLARRHQQVEGLPTWHQYD